MSKRHFELVNGKVISELRIEISDLGICKIKKSVENPTDLNY